MKAKHIHNLFEFKQKINTIHQLINDSEAPERSKSDLNQIVDMARMAPTLLDYLIDTNEAMSIMAMSEKLQSNYNEEVGNIIKNSRHLILAATEKFRVERKESFVGIPPSTLH